MKRLLLVQRLGNGNQKDKGTHEQLKSSAIALRATNDTEGNDPKVQLQHYLERERIARVFIFIVIIWSTWKDRSFRVERIEVLQLRELDVVGNSWSFNFQETRRVNCTYSSCFNITEVRD